ncbi:MAG TPA: hypothetical protein VMA34_16520 [Terracidiphilus sp.]|nr:hypothetical protein [Terracidiphilus sp.]
MSGAPWSSRAKAYGPDPKGSENDREGANGFSYWVGRSFAEFTQTTVEPTCFDFEGSRTNMIRRKRMEEPRADGKSASLQLSLGIAASFVLADNDDAGAISLCRKLSGADSLVTLFVRSRFIGSSAAISIDES